MTTINSAVALSALVDAMRAATIADNDTASVGASFVASLLPAGKAGAARTAKHAQSVADCLNEGGASFVDNLRAIACLKGTAMRALVASLLAGSPSAKDKKRAAALEKAAARMLGKNGTGNAGIYLNGCALSSALKRAGMAVTLKEGVFTVSVIADKKAEPVTLADKLDAIDKEADKDEGAKWTRADIVAAIAARYGADVIAYIDEAMKADKKRAA